MKLLYCENLSEAEFVVSILGDDDVIRLQKRTWTNGESGTVNEEAFVNFLKTNRHTTVYPVDAIGYRWLSERSELIATCLETIKEKDRVWVSLIPQPTSTFNVS